MTRTVKLTSREPTEYSIEAARKGFQADYSDGYFVQKGLQKAHDAAPEDATKALQDLLWAVQQLRHGPNSEYAVHARYVDLYLGKFAQTPEGAALIRQAEEPDDG